ncbi:MAG: YciI family protein [Geminicoccaceae bacterium]
MQWLIIARDGADDEAPKRRLKARPAHLEHAAKLQDAGHLIVGGALIDDNGQMIGTAAVAQFATREELDHWLSTDPYVTGDVWREVEVHPYRVAPHYDVPACPVSTDDGNDSDRDLQGRGTE